MNFSGKRLKYTFISALSILSLSSVICPVYAVDDSDIAEKSAQSSELEQTLQSVNQEIQDLESQIAQLEVEMEETDGEIEKTEEQLLIAQNSQQEQYEDMKMRIKYLYENDDDDFIEIILTAKSMKDLLNKVDFVQSVNSYDREKLETLVELEDTIAEQQEQLEETQESQQELQTELDSQRSQLTAKAKETSSDLDLINSEIETLKEEQRKEAEEKAAREAEEAAAKKAKEEAEKAKKKTSKSEKKATTSKKSGNSSSSGKNSSNQSSSSNKGSDSSTTYAPSTNSGALTKSKGVVYYNGHRETYYSQRVLPGTGLKIPGRHVASDGTIRDQDNYICVASSDLAKGTIVETSLGTGKVYDSGCASGTIDLYTDW
jgi:peptidoglycan hydrolase CwlO-like protein